MMPPTAANIRGAFQALSGWVIRVAILSLTAVSFGQENVPHISDWRPPVDEARLRPKMLCSALRSLTGYDFSVITARNVEAANGIPAHCRVLGQVLPEVKFEVVLPDYWNHRLFMFGNGGYAGEDLDPPPRREPGPPGSDGLQDLIAQAPARRVRVRNSALQSGFVVTSTNTGHDAAQEPLGSFAVNSQKLLDYAFRSLHVTAETAKKIAAAHYGAAVSRSYYFGCSTGGRQGLIFAQRFPDDFDGIVAGAPVLNFSGSMVRFAVTGQALAKSPIPISKLQLLAERVYGGCDGKDGLKDGLIDDPRRCNFVPSRDLPVCEAGDSDTCFTPGQVKALDVFYSDVFSQGKRIFPGWPVGAEIAPPRERTGWDPWFVREQGPALGVTFAETFFRYLAFPKKDPTYTLDRFDLERDPERLEWINGVLNATDTDLTAFQSRGGKLLMYFGWADPSLNPRMGVEYYEAVERKMGPATDDFFHLFMMPGVFHCWGGVGPAAFDPLDAVIQWVEHRRKPESLLASQIQDGKAIRTRPLCPYPLVARYKGSGSIKEASNFTCTQP